jgi:hypothetical protein
VTRTWAEPYWVSTASPVAEPDAVVAAADFAGVGDAVGVVDAVAVWTAGVWAWKASTPAVPAAVAARTIGDLRIRT